MNSEAVDFRVLLGYFPSMDTLDFLKLPEGKTLEFKENIQGKTGILSTLVAFSNTSGGRLIIGVRDHDKSIVGIENPIKVEEALSNLIDDSLSPKILPNIEIISWRGLHLIIVEVYPSPNRPHYIRSKGVEKSAYVRIGSTNRVADQELIKSLKREIHGKSYDENPLIDVTDTVFDPQLSKKLFGSQRAITKNHLKSLGALETFGNRLHPTIGGTLLFTQDPSEYIVDAWIQCGRFKGSDKTHIVDSQKLRGPLPFLVDEAMDFLGKHLNKGLEIGKTKHIEQWTIPQVALREAIINSLVHTDYSLTGAPIRIAIFNDRVEIENSGILPTGVTFQDLMRGVSKIRNRVISRVFHEINLIEQWGSGITRIINTCQEFGLKDPIFEEIGTRFRVTIYTEKNTPPKLDNVDQRIIALLKEKGNLSTSEISKEIRLTPRSIRPRLSKLIEKGLLLEISSSKTDPHKKFTLVD